MLPLLYQLVRALDQIPSGGGEPQTPTILDQEFHAQRALVLPELCRDRRR